ncbi:MAG: hypothetical protein NT022_09730 [Deltaproteobacteria bacterium]|nr:hypothetical protein [Deltaproteobacteria bacterium]
MTENFLEKGLIKEVISVESPEMSKPLEGNVILIIKKINDEGKKEYTINCFVPFVGEISQFKKGENRVIKLVLTNWARKNIHIEGKEKTLNLDGSTTITGEVIKILDDSKYADSFNAIIDCGIYIKVRFFKSQNFKIGDYIKATGRLDAYLADNGKKRNDVK